MGGAHRRYSNMRLLLAAVVAYALSATDVAQSPCDSGWVAEELPRTFKGATCSGNDSFESIMTYKTATITTAVICQTENWKSAGTNLGNWEVFGFSECEQAAQGGPPGCEATFEPAQWAGVVNGKHQFRRAIQNVHADESETGCDYGVGDLVIAEHNDWTADGCCASVCQDEASCEAQTSPLASIGNNSAYARRWSAPNLRNVSSALRVRRTRSMMRVATAAKRHRKEVL